MKDVHPYHMIILDQMVVDKLKDKFLIKKYIYQKMEKQILPDA